MFRDRARRRAPGRWTGGSPTGGAPRVEIDDHHVILRLQQADGVGQEAGRKGAEPMACGGLPGSGAWRAPDARLQGAGERRKPSDWARSSRLSRGGSPSCQAPDRPLWPSSTSTTRGRSAGATATFTAVAAHTALDPTSVSTGGATCPAGAHQQARTRARTLGVRRLGHVIVGARFEPRQPGGTCVGRSASDRQLPHPGSARMRRQIS